LRLVFEGAALDDVSTIEDAGLQNGSVVSLAKCAREVIVEMSTGMRIVRGSQPMQIDVGSERNCPAWAQNPPAKDDTWEVDFVSEAVEYDVIFEGGDNNWHGKLRVLIDGEPIGEFDQYVLQTVYPSEKVLRWTAPSGGQHTLSGIVASKHPEANGYWICIRRIMFRPASLRDDVSALAGGD